MKKITKENIEQMNILRKEGKTIREIAKIFNVAYQAVRYHIIDGVKEKSRNYVKKLYNQMNEKEKKEYLDRRREYQKEYHKRRYKLDPEFRRKQIERVTRK
jgi:predicted DNA-binding protein YlxM (UPF0122 family)